MAKYKQTKVENPEQYEKPIYPDLSYHRSYFFKWEFMETKIYGGHEWNYYKPSPREIDIDKEYSKYFDKYNIYKKQLYDLCEEYFPINWIPINKIYIVVIYGEIDIKSVDMAVTKLNMGTEEGKDFFNSKNILTVKDFLRWILLIASWENIESMEDIINRFHFLFEKFKIFVTTDMTPSMIATYFNKKLESLPDHNIEPISSIQYSEYYKFIMNPKVYSISVKAALDKLFYLINKSNYLKGNYANFKPSFPKYTQYIDKIFNCVYNNWYLKEIDAIRRLNENELQYFDTNGKPEIKDDIVIPNEILEKYSLLPLTKKEEIIPISKEEINDFIKKSNEIATENKIKLHKSLDEIVNKYTESEPIKRTKAEQKLIDIEKAKEYVKKT